MPKHKDYAPEIRARVVGLRDGGKRAAQIAEEMKIPLRTVYSFMKTYRERGTSQTKARSGRPHVVPDALAHPIGLLLKRGQLTNGTSIQKWLEETEDIVVSISTVHRFMHKIAFYPYIKARKPKLTAAQRKDRVSTANFFLTMTSSQQKLVVFSDETTFCQFETGRRKFIWLPKGHPFCDQFLQPTFPFGGKSFRLWAAITRDGVLAHRVIPDAFTGDVYRDIIKKELIPHAKAKFGRSRWTFQQDRASQHTAKPTMRLLAKAATQHRMQLLPWPAHSPDLNPIENLWAEIEDRLSTGAVPATKNALIARVEAIIKELRTENGGAYFHNLCDSARERFEAVKTNGGRILKY